MKISHVTIENVKSMVSIIEVIGKYIPSIPSGRQNIKCPFHDDKTPSFAIYPDTGKYYCFGSCQEGGDVISFVQKMEGLDFNETVKKLCDDFGIELKMDQSSFCKPENGPKFQKEYDLLEKVRLLFHGQIENDEVKGFLEDRKVNPDHVRTFHLGYSPFNRTWLFDQLTQSERLIAIDLKLLRAVDDKIVDVFSGRLLFPLFDFSRRCVGFSGRIISKSINAPKYLNSAESSIFNKSEILFGWLQGLKSIGKTKKVVITEGCMDVIGAHRLGIKNAVAICGATLSEYQIRKIKSDGFSVELCLDNDDAGKAATIKMINQLAAAGVQVAVRVLPDSFKDLDELSLHSDKEMTAVKPDFDILVEHYLSPNQDIEERIKGYKAIAEYLTNIINESRRLLIISELKKHKLIDKSVLDVNLKGMNSITKQNSRAHRNNSNGGHDTPEYHLPYDGESFIQRSTKSSLSPEISQFGLIKLIEYLKFHRAKYADNEYFIKLDDNIARIVDHTDVQYEVFQYVQGLPEVFTHVEYTYSRKWLIEVLTRQNITIFSPAKLTLLKRIEIPPFKEQKGMAYFFYKNGVVRITASEIVFLRHIDYDHIILESQIINRHFPVHFLTEKKMIPDGQFGDFLFLISDKNHEQLESLRTILGYLMHQNYPGGEKAVILTDSNVSSEPNGRTGKGIIGHGLNHMRKMTTIPGKSMKMDSQFKYQQVEPVTQIVHLEDVNPRFKFETLFNDITDQMLVERKNKNPFSIRTKILISTNRTIDLNGNSSKARAIEFELSDYFSLHRTPDQEFQGYLFNDWKAEKAVEWEYFDLYMIHCMQLYLKKGLIYPKNKNLPERKLLDSVGKDFYEWAIQQDFKVGVHYPRKDYKRKFMDAAGIDNEFYWTSQRFLSCLKKLAEFKNLVLKTKSSNSVEYFYFDERHSD